MTVKPVPAENIVDSLCELVGRSIIERYDGELEKCEDPRMKVGPHYVPLDDDEIRKLLNTLWGEFVAVQILDQVFATLMKDGADEWPNAYCQEELDAERECRLASIDFDIECAERQLKVLTEERDRLIGQSFDKWYAEEYHRLTP